MIYICYKQRLVEDAISAVAGTLPLLDLVGCLFLNFRQSNIVKENLNQRALEINRLNDQFDCRSIKKYGYKRRVAGKKFPHRTVNILKSLEYEEKYYAFA